jgi:GTP-binding nuclear protein Ran
VIITKIKSEIKMRFIMLIPNMASQVPTKSIKVVFIGNGGCGKTTFLNRISRGNFEQKYKPTLGVDVSPIPESIWRGGDNIDKNVTFNCWDCTGQKRFGILQTSYYTGANVIVVCFTSGSRLEHESIKEWVEMAQTCPSAKIILMGTKIDIGRLIPEETAFPLVEISSKDCLNLYEPFKKIYELCC